MVSTEDTRNSVSSVFLVASDSSYLSGDGANDDGENKKHSNSILNQTSLPYFGLKLSLVCLIFAIVTLG